MFFLLSTFPMLTSPNLAYYVLIMPDYAELMPTDPPNNACLVVLRHVSLHV
jgi:hypothetical protein